MEEQGSILLQKKMILAVFTILFTCMSVSGLLINELKKAETIMLASNNEAIESNANIEEIENDIILIEQIAYAAGKSVEEKTEDVIEIQNDEEMPKEEVQKEIIEERLQKSAEKVSRNGTRENTITEQKYVSYRELAEDNPPTEYKDVIGATATAYCLCQKCCGKLPSHPSYGYTASGLRIVPGTGMKVIAVDPKVIPLGTKVYIDGLNGAWDYGNAIAADTGSAIKNLTIDLYMDTHSEALSWGRRSVNIYVVD